ncbi:MAG: hypothetical protein OXN17_19675, partial [Candidatus Poribacteria bacterium]|nr:hypothetical protein [Candidatus Poribacteria bacterium]
MVYNAVFFFSLLFSITRLVIATQVFAQPEAVPPDVLELRPEGYVYADYPGVFDNVTSVGIDRRRGLTVEAWINLTDRPKDDFYFSKRTREGQWPIFAKPGNYHVVLRGRNLDKGFDVMEPNGTAILEFYLNRGGGRAVIISPEEYPLNRWLHVAMYVVEKEGKLQKRVFYDGIHRGGGSTPELMARTHAPFVIGGPPIITFKDGMRWGHKYESMKGYVDVVRVSRGLRYDVPKGESIHPSRQLHRETQTVALWQFEEGPGAP